MMNGEESFPRGFRLLRWSLFLVLTYFLFFCLLTFPLIGYFPTHLFGDKGDALQNVWSLWWFQKAIAKLHVCPWSTRYLHFPHGTSLFGDCMNPFNGVVGLFLIPFFGLIRTYNLELIGAFALAGVSAFFLAFYLTRRPIASFVAGCVFSFSNHHFAQAQGHLPQVSLQWIPLYVLTFLLALSKPSVPRAIVAALSLFLVALCDYYYFTYCVLISVFLLVWRAGVLRDGLFFLRKPYRIAALAFLISGVLTCGPIFGSLFIENQIDPLLGSHEAGIFSTDLLAFVIPGGHWLMHRLTQPYWSALSGNIHESSVHLGSGAILLAYSGWRLRARSRLREAPFCTWIAISFAVLSLGPVLHIWGREVPGLKLPYGLLERLFPPLHLSGVPSRMMAVVFLFAGIWVGAGFEMLFRGSPRERKISIGLLALMLVEFLPRPLPRTRMEVPGYVSVLRGSSSDYGLAYAGRAYDYDPQSRQFFYPRSAGPLLHAPLFFQTMHEIPMTFGLLSRQSVSVTERDMVLSQLIKNGGYQSLCTDFGVRYLLTSTGTPPRRQLPEHPIYQDDAFRLYDLGREWTCKRIPVRAKPTVGPWPFFARIGSSFLKTKYD